MKKLKRKSYYKWLRNFTVFCTAIFLAAVTAIVLGVHYGQTDSLWLVLVFVIAVTSGAFAYGGARTLPEVKKNEEEFLRSLETQNIYIFVSEDRVDIFII